LRGGPSPEVWRTTFESSTNATNWVFLGDASRIAGGWELAGQTLPPGSRIRARGFTSGGGFTASSWFAETISGACYFITQPGGRTNNAGTPVAFAVVAGGTPPLNFQWLKDGNALQNNGQVSGAQTAILSLSNVFGADAGGYSVMVSNSFGSITSVVANLKAIDPLLTSQPVSRTNNAQTTATFTVAAVGTSPLSYQWRKAAEFLSDGGNISGSQTATLTLSNVLRADAGSYSVIVSSSFGNLTSSVAALTILEPLILTNPVSQVVTQPQSVQLSVVAAGTPPLNYQWRKNGNALGSATAPTLTLTNLQWIDGGDFVVAVSNLYGSVTSAVATIAVSSAIADSFNPGADHYVHALALQSDGRILAGGHFTQLGGQSRPYLGRLNPDSSLDTSFNPGADYDVTCMLVQTDGKIVVGGGFTNLCGQVRNAIGRLDPDGSLDPSFNPAADLQVNCLLEQPDGKILVGGDFSYLGGQSRKYLGRLNRDGTLDSAFIPDVDQGVNSLVLQPDGKLLVGGAFTLLNGQPRACIGRLNTDGTLDNSFNAGVIQPGLNAYPTVETVMLQPDGRILLGGFFRSIGAFAVTNLARLNADGTPDTSLHPFARYEWDSASCLALQN
jgi:uncharacterized delta-60 repeat protein